MNVKQFNRRKMGKKKKKEFPRVLKQAAEILLQVEGGASIQNSIYQSKSRNINGLYNLVASAYKNKDLLNEIVEKTGLCYEELDPFLVKILVAELLWGKKMLPPRTQVSEVVLSYQSQLEAAVEESPIPVSVAKVVKPQYARVNTLLTTVDGTVNRLKDDGWLLLDTPDSFEKFLECARDLEEKEFMKDFHFEDLLVFSPKISRPQFSSLELVRKYKLIHQDKSAHVAPALLNPPPGSTVLDMCAAPGRKTAHLASLMKNQGCLYAVDVDETRLSLLDAQIPNWCGSHHCVKSSMQDCRRLTSDLCPNVKYILIDPASSGTGLKLLSDMEDVNTSDDVNTRDDGSARFDKYGKFQERLLVQAMTAFPSVRRIVYSTCSVVKEENEEVIARALARVPEFHVVPPAVTGWEKRGNPNYEFGSNCVVANHPKYLMNGFFVAVLERIEKNEEIESEEVGGEVEKEWMKPKKSFRKRKLGWTVSDTQDTDSMDVDAGNVEMKKKRK